MHLLFESWYAARLLLYIASPGSVSHLHQNVCCMHSNSNMQQGCIAHTAILYQQTVSHVVLSVIKKLRTKYFVSLI